MPDFREHLYEKCQLPAIVINGSMTHPILKKPQTLVESIIQRYATRPTDELDTTGTRRIQRISMQATGSDNEVANLQLVA
jgi:hypothetical protein